MKVLGYDLDYIREPAYLVWRDREGTLHVEVEEEIGEHVIWDMKEGKLVKKFDKEDASYAPF